MEKSTILKIRIVWIFCLSANVSLMYAKEHSLDLLSAERMALKKSWGRAVYVQESEKIAYELKEKKGSLLPTLSVFHTTSTDDARSFSHNPAVGIKQNIPNPFKNF